MGISIQRDIPLAPYTTFKVGGNTSHFAEVHSEDDLQEAVRFSKVHGLRLVVLGGGSNVLFSDSGLDALVIKIGIKGVEPVVAGTKVVLEVGAGELLDDVIAYTVDQGWWGMENLSHIPGTVGATPVQNVGAYGVETQNLVEHVRVFNMKTETFEEFSASACAFGYRDSVFKHDEGKHYVITKVAYRLSTQPDPKITYRDLARVFVEGEPSLLAIREAVMKIRAGKFPDWKRVGTAGSFFKNPIVKAELYERLHDKYPELPGFTLEDGRVKVPLGWILDKVLSLRGFTLGNVEAYENQALVVVAHAGATAAEIEAFANDVAARVLSETGIAIEWEVTKIY